MATSTGPTPPHSLEAEMGLLGSLLLACADSSEIFERLQPEHFYSRRHEIIYRAIRTLFDQHGSVDTILLSEHLEREGLATEAGGIDYLLELTDSVRTSINASKYTDIICDRAILRRLITTCTELVQGAYEGVEDAKQYLEYAEQAIFEISDQGNREGVVPLKDAIKEHIRSTGSDVPGVHRHCDRFRRSGWNDDGAPAIGARSGGGATQYGEDHHHHEHGEAPRLSTTSGRCSVFSLEVDSTQIAMNMLCGGGPGEHPGFAPLLVVEPRLATTDRRRRSTLRSADLHR